MEVVPDSWEERPNTPGSRTHLTSRLNCLSRPSLRMGHGMSRSQGEVPRLKGVGLEMSGLLLRGVPKAIMLAYRVHMVIPTSKALPLTKTLPKSPMD